MYYRYPNGDEAYNVDIVYMTSVCSGIPNTNDESKDHGFFAIEDLS